MIIQPFVENALKHGLLHKKGMKKLTISFSMNEQLICEIEDNGIGRKHAQEIKERQRNSTSSFATQATEKRIELLNSVNSENYSFQIIDLEEMGQAKGTLVRITLPIH
jgi:sensor histidine kinase YesM